MQTAYKTLISLLILSLIFSSNLSAQTNAGVLIKGRILNESGDPLAYASVFLRKTGDTLPSKVTQTNNKGAFEIFTSNKRGDFVITVKMIGYKPAVSSPFIITGSSTINIPDISMQLLQQSLKDVKVAGTKPLIEQSGQKLIVNVENSVLAAGGNALDVLGRSPGVDADKDGNITLNGKPGVTVMINDKPTYLSPAQLATLLRSTTANSIQSIEILTNPSAKYEAAGTGGIINIKLKKNVQEGTHVTVIAGAGYGHSLKNNESITITQKVKKFNWLGSFNHFDDKFRDDLDIFRTLVDNTGTTTHLSQYSVTNDAIHTNSYRLEGSYDLSKKNTLGMQVSGYFNTEEQPATITTYIGSSGDIKADSFQNTYSTVNLSYKNFSANVNDVFHFDSAGQSLALDMDYRTYSNNSAGQFNTYFFQPNGSMAEGPYFLRDQTPSTINIFAVKADYIKPLSKTLTLEAGAKHSDVSTDNILNDQVLENGVYVNDSLLSNHFIHKEKIDAAYTNFSWTFPHGSLQAGVRSEYTTTFSNLVGHNNEVSGHYLDFFPSVSYSHISKNKNQLGFSYSRRIDRPSYADLNPFIFYLDQYAYQKGNPFLKPQYSNNFEAHYSLKRIFFTAAYTYINNFISTIVLTDFSTKASFQTNLNLTNQSSMRFAIIAPYTATKWWRGNVSVNGIYFHYRADSLLGANFTTGKFSYLLRTTQTFSVSSANKIEFFGSYTSPIAANIFVLRPVYYFDCGYSHSFTKGSIKLSLNDIFNTRQNMASSTYQSIYNYTSKHESRIIRLTFTYNLGNTKINVAHHNGGATEESNRVNGSN